jgi:hypothetical protein
MVERTVAAAGAEGVGTAGVLLGAALALPDANSGALDGVLGNRSVSVLCGGGCEGSSPCRTRGKRNASAG